MRKSTLSVQVILIFLATFLSTQSAVGQDTLPDFYILPKSAEDQLAGDDLVLTCKYPNYISNLQWIDQDGNVLTPDNAVIRSRNNEYSLTLENLSPKLDGTYTCSGSNKNENDTTVQLKISVTVYKPVEITSPKVQKFLRGTNAEVQCSVEGDPEPAVEWSLGDTVIDTNGSKPMYFIPSPNNSLIIKNVQKSDEKEYKCTAFQPSKGKQKIQDTTVDVIFAPSKVEVKEMAVGVKGGSVTLTCIADAEPEPTYRWRKDGLVNNTGFITEGLQNNGTTLVLSNMDSSDQGNYTCVVTNEVGHNTGTTMVAVHVPPTISFPHNVTVKTGEGTTFRCVASGVPKPTVGIYRNGLLIEELPINSNATRFAVYDSKGGEITFDSVSFEDAGKYECRADNSVARNSATMNLFVLYSPRDTMLQDVYACPNEEAELKCRFDAYPSPSLQWGEMKEIPSDVKPLNESDPIGTTPTTSLPSEFVPVASDSSSIQFEDDGTLVYRISPVTQDSFKTYYCQANNSEGNNRAASKLKPASVPGSPSIAKFVDVNTRSAVVTFSPPDTILVPILTYTLNITNLKTKKSKTRTKEAGKKGNSPGSKMRTTFDNLGHDTDYEVTVTATNCKGEGPTSPAKTFNTDRIVDPKSPIITSNSTGGDDEYTVEWKAEETGGGTIQKVTITYKAVDLGENETDAQKVVLDASKEGFKSQSYTLSDLQPSTQYRITVSIKNEVGQAEASRTIRTSAVPTEGPSGNDNKEKPNVAGFDPMLIGIILAAIILILILLDVICCATRHCGLFHVIYTNTCAPSGSSKEGIQDAEEGSAEYRKDNKTDEVACTVTTEKQPLAEDVEPIANGAEQEMVAVNEETPLHADQSSGDGTADKKPQKAEKDLSIEDVKAEVCVSEKEPLA